MTMMVLMDSILNIKRIVASKWIFYSCITQDSAEAGGGKKFFIKFYFAKVVHLINGQMPW